MVLFSPVLSAQSIRRGSLEPHGVDYYPMHDLDDIHENHQADHQQHASPHQQYHTVNGNYAPAHGTSAADKRAIFSDTQRNSIFHTALSSASDSTASVAVDPFASVVRVRPPRFDNTSFSKDLAETVTGSSSGTAAKEKSSKTSLQGMLKTFGKKTHLWPRKRTESTCTISLITSPVNDPQEQFRTRSKSLDVNYHSEQQHHILNDCDATYKIFDKIVREGKK